MMWLVLILSITSFSVIFVFNGRVWAHLDYYSNFILSFHVSIFVRYSSFALGDWKTQKISHSRHILWRFQNQKNGQSENIRALDGNWLTRNEGLLRLFTCIIFVKNQLIFPSVVRFEFYVYFLLLFSIWLG